MGKEEDGYRIKMLFDSLYSHHDSEDDYKPIVKENPKKVKIDNAIKAQFPNPVGEEVEKVRHLKALMYKKIRK